MKIKGEIRCSGRVKFPAPHALVMMSPMSYQGMKRTHGIQMSLAMVVTETW